MIGEDDDDDEETDNQLAYVVDDTPPPPSTDRMVQATPADVPPVDRQVKDLIKAMVDDVDAHMAIAEAMEQQVGGTKVLEACGRPGQQEARATGQAVQEFNQTKGCQES